MRSFPPPAFGGLRRLKPAFQAGGIAAVGVFCGVPGFDRYARQRVKSFVRYAPRTHFSSVVDVIVSLGKQPPIGFFEP